MTATPNDGRQDVLRTAEDQCAQEGAIARAMQSNIDRAPHPLAAAPAVAPDEREAEHLPFAPEQRWAMWNEWDAAHPETTGEYDAFLGGLAAALAARPAPVVSGEAVALTDLVAALQHLCDDEWLRRRDRMMRLDGTRSLRDDGASEIEYAAHSVRRLIESLPGYDPIGSGGAYLTWMRNGRDAGITAADAPAADDEPCRCGPERCGGDAPTEPSRDCSVHGEAADDEGGRA